MPVWPLFRQNATATELVGYVFESLDLAPIPGFSGVPVNLLIAIDPKGSFLDVAVLSQHEPVFLDGLGEAPLFQFVKQYQGLSLKQKSPSMPGRNARRTPPMPISMACRRPRLPCASSTRACWPRP
ncbi:Uncharacterised protein [Janthinobacterium lividum]|uniref:hypothetical protein n=1 Tax=Janthinobacterium lividum TaxID=29581 RepID=UPI000E0706EE|nr:hypothetical protein [Janthinobacterium lividum]STR25376.1 Uncharacterised protein [Janthinobacterium lividum]